MEIKTSCIPWETEKFSRKSLNGKLTRPSEDREKLSKNCTKLKLKLRREIGKRDVKILFFKRSIKNLNLNDFNYIKQIDEQIKLSEIKLAFMENWNWEISSPKRIMQESAKKLKNWGKFVATKQIEQDKQELMNCPCIKREIVRLWVNWWLRFGNYRSEQILCHMPENFTILNQEAALERPTFPIRPLLFWVPELGRAAILDCRVIHKMVRVLQGTFLNDHLLKKGYPLQYSTIQRIWHHPLKYSDLVLSKRQEKETAKTSLP